MQKTGRFNRVTFKHEPGRQPGQPAEGTLSLAARLDDPLEAFIGCAASGRTEPFDIHRERVDAAGKKIAQGI